MGSSWILLLLSIVLPAVLLANAQGPTTCENTRIAYESVQTVGAVSDAVHSSPISQSKSIGLAVMMFSALAACCG